MPILNVNPWYYFLHSLCIIHNLRKRLILDPFFETFNSSCSRNLKHFGNPKKWKFAQKSQILWGKWISSRAFALSHELDFSGERVAHTRSNEYKHFLFHNFFSDFSNFIKICLERNHKITLKLIQSQPCLFSFLQFSKHL